ncbi:nitrate reductase subunit alpha [Acetobacter orientalis]|uniref:Nitrate reductase subunit alpha n=1 Tax=Acetobacter orientalis TaxID=146474 RepID=A0A2Z5ZMC1_9PROT|nr:nitrate reductase subunit alpha [Acetobacter orientalis]
MLFFSLRPHHYMQTPPVVSIIITGCARGFEGVVVFVLQLAHGVITEF